MMSGKWENWDGIASHIISISDVVNLILISLTVSRLLSIVHPIKFGYKHADKTTEYFTRHRFQVTRRNCELFSFINHLNIVEKWKNLRKFYITVELIFAPRSRERTGFRSKFMRSNWFAPAQFTWSNWYRIKFKFKFKFIELVTIGAQSLLHQSWYRYKDMLEVNIYCWLIFTTYCRHRVTYIRIRRTIFIEIKGRWLRIIDLNGVMVHWTFTKFKRFSIVIVTIFKFNRCITWYLNIHNATTA